MSLRSSLFFERFPLSTVSTFPPFFGLEREKMAENVDAARVSCGEKPDEKAG